MMGELTMPEILFPDPLKYFTLLVSVSLLLFALGVLLWQVFRCCTQSHTTQDTTNDDPFTDYYASTTANCSGAPRTMAEGVGVQSGFLPLGSIPSALSAGEDGELDEQASQEKVSGSLHFSLFYDQLQSRLVVTVLQAEGLQGRSHTQRLRPFVRLRLMRSGPEEEAMERSSNEKEEGKALCTVLREWNTHIVQDCCSPLFGDQFSCSMLPQGELRHITLRMEVKDFDKFSRHMILGEVRVPMRHLKIFYPLELQEYLQTPQKDPVGEMLLSLKFLPTAQRLEVGLLKFRMLLPDTSSNTALYARVSVQCNQHKLRHRKTSAVARCHVTVFNQVLMFSLPEVPMQECSIVTSVYETDTTRTYRRLLGQMNVQKDMSSEDHHWTLMMRSIRQPIALWHQLLI